MYSSIDKYSNNRLVTQDSFCYTHISLILCWTYMRSDSYYHRKVNMTRANTDRRPSRNSAHGRQIKDDSSKSGILRFFLGFLIPYLVINGLILFFVIQTPTITADEPDTKDYKSADVSFKVSSLIPMKSVIRYMLHVMPTLCLRFSSHVDCHSLLR